MSGKKKAYVSISQEEYHRLQNAEIALRSQENSARRQEKIQQKTRSHLLKQYHRLEDRQSDFIRSVSSLRDEILEIEDLNAQQLLDHKADLLNQVDQLADAQFDSVQSFFEAKRTDLLDELSTIQAERENALRNALSELHASRRDHRWKASLAADWIHSASNLLDHLTQHFGDLPQAADLAPEYEKRILLAQQNFRDGLPEAALAAGQNIYIELSQARLQLEAYLQERDLLLHSAQSFIERLQDDLQASRICNAIDMDGNLISVEIDVNAWTDGRLQDLDQSLALWLADTDEDSPLDIDQLNTLLHQDLPALEQAIPEAVHDARMAALDAQIRINIADLIIQALLKQDFHLQSSNYLSPNTNSGYFALAANREGSQVKVLVNPTGRGIGDNELFLDLSSSHPISDNEYRSQAAAITQSLARFGLRSENLSQISASEFYRPFNTARSAQPLRYEHHP